ncbi:MAG: tetratricopeptide repeat protein [Anaerolineae bacterium]
MIVVALVLASVGGLLFARALPPRWQDELISRVPELVRPLAQSLILPDYPDVIPTPITHVSADISALLTPPPTATPTATPTSTPAPTLTPTPASTRSSSTTRLTLTPVVPPGPAQAARSTPASIDAANLLLTGFRHAYQTWNNCGPATLMTNLSYFGWAGNQADAAQFLKPAEEDVNVSPHEMAAFAQTAGLSALMRANGSMLLIKQFLQAGIPVLIEKGFEPDAELDWMGHYELVIGYSDSRGEFIAMDSYTGPNQAVPYDVLDWYWSHFNRTYLIVYEAEQAETVMQLLGADADPTSNAAAALASAQAEASANPSNPFAWFNVGTNFVALGEYESAAAAYDQARSLGLPWRMTWYQFGIFEAYYHTGRFDDVLALADATLAKTPYIEELWYYRGLVHQARGELDAARDQFNQALHYNPNFTVAAGALATLGQ